MKTSPEDRAIDNFPVESYDDRVQRITKRELIRSHRALPVLVESLLFCVEFSEQENEPSLPIDLVLNICHFSQKMKWLCFWGPEIIDESSRPPSTSEPRCIQEKERTAIEEIRLDQIRSLLQDSEQNWDRISLDLCDSSFFKFLHLHPCEELRFTFLMDSLSQKSIRNIAKCANLRVIDMGSTIVPSDLMLALRRLPNLKILMNSRRDHPVESFRTNINFPLVTNIPVIDLERGSPEDVSEMLSSIHSRRNTARQIHLKRTPKREIIEALAQCTQVQSIQIDGFSELYENDYHILFASSNLQKTVQHICIDEEYVGQRAFHFLQKFTNLNWLEFYNMGTITATYIASIVRANAHHLYTLTISNCYNVGDSLLDAISICKSLHSIDIIETGVTPEAIARYCETKKPNWQDLNYIKWRVNPTRVPSINYTNDENEGELYGEYWEWQEWMDFLYESDGIY